MGMGPSDLTEQELEALCRWYAHSIANTCGQAGALTNTGDVGQMNARLGVLQGARRDVLAAAAATVDTAVLEKLDRPPPRDPSGPG